MGYFIFNHDIDKSQIATEAMSVNAEEILFQGVKEQFESLGFNESQLGGFELVNGVLTFNQELFNNAQKQKLPIAQGKDLVSFIEKALIQVDDDTADFFLMNLSGLWKYLQTGKTNPLTEISLNWCLSKVQSNTVFSIQQKAMILELVNTWKNTVRFE